ncbi:glycosyltransferase family 2 protein [Lysobacter sp. P5_B9]
MSRPQHAFVVPAYRDSPHLRECLASLRGQQSRSPVIVCTSTPYEGLAALCDEMEARLVCHSPNRGIAHDWNMALGSAHAEWVTIAHQDDVYLPDFADRTLRLIERNPAAILVFTGYSEMDQGGIRALGVPLRIKQILIELAMLGRESIETRFARTNLLRFGCPIPCPSVTLRRTSLPQGFAFDQKFRVNLDWDFWLRLARESKGAFACDRKVLMHHRIHPGSETTSGIADGVRMREDRELFGRVWPAPIASLIAKAYALSYRYNQA